MPNWCDNELIITGDKEAIKKFLDIMNRDSVKKTLMLKKEDFHTAKIEYLNKIRENNGWKKNLKRYVKLKQTPSKDFVAEVLKHTILEDGNAYIIQELGILSKFYPMPEILDKISFGGEEEKKEESELLKQALKETGSENGYHWRINNWGTKWDIGNIEDMGYDINDTEIVINFSSAWSPPENWLKKVGNDYPELTFELKFSEPGCGFKGSLIIDGGEVVEETTEEYYGDCGECEVEYDESGRCNCDEEEC